MNIYQIDMRELEFLLFEQFDVNQLFKDCELDDQIDESTYRSVLEVARRFSCERLGPLYQSADREGCTLRDDGTVQVPKGFKELWDAYRELGWGAMFSTTETQQGVPMMAALPLLEMQFGANPSFMIYTGFALPLSQLIRQHDRTGAQAEFRNRLIDSSWGACICLTEPGAGSDVGQIRTRAVRQTDGSYRIFGSKIFISSGSHEMADNLLYAVLARVEGAPAGTAGLSCFLVPRKRQDGAGQWQQPNGVTCVRLEDKMGLRACATAELLFEDAHGSLLGERENIGLQQIFSLLSQARFSTGIFGLGMASSAYLFAQSYASERVQGSDAAQAFSQSAPRLTIINHADVRRMLLEMKSKVEGSRALLCKVALHHSYSHEPLLSKTDKALVKRHDGLYKLLTPIVKAYISDQAWRVCELAIQVMGGHGFIRDYPLEQYARDVKILSLWEGTNYMQAADLVRDKIAMGRGSMLVRWFVEDITAFLDAQSAIVGLEGELDILRSALAGMGEAIDLLGGWTREKRLDLVFGYATRILELVSEVALSWMLLEAACIAKAKLDCDGLTPDERLFYEGKVLSARYFVRNHLVAWPGRLAVLRSADDSLLNSTAALASGVARCS
jgi:alkylation response protein AidB-like acyl-CoA dehydrogenase